jgi:SAM-dependent methyltransferase
MGGFLSGFSRFDRWIVAQPLTMEEPRMVLIRSGVAIQAGARPRGYYDQARPEVAHLVPRECGRVLEIGCGSGQLGCLLQQRGHRVTGVELVPEAAEQARAHLDAVVCADIETEGLDLPEGSFQALVLADVLEHLVDPWGTLARLVRLLEPGGVVVVSVPNVQNLDVIWRLVRGRWDYRERGLLDIGHLRFFTLASILKLFREAGLRIETILCRYRRNWWRGALCLVTLGWARAFFTRQYLVVGRLDLVG